MSEKSVKKNRPYQPYQQRMLEERFELEERIHNLEAFTQNIGGVFNCLEYRERRLLLRQLACMGLYFDTLVERIEAFETGE